LLHLTTLFHRRMGDPLDLHSFPTRRSSDLASNLYSASVFGRPSLSRNASRSSGGASSLGTRMAFPSSFSWLKACLTSAFGSFIKDRKSTRLNSSHVKISYAVFCLKKKIKIT